MRKVWFKPLKKVILSEEVSEKHDKYCPRQELEIAQRNSASHVWQKITFFIKLFQQKVY